MQVQHYSITPVRSSPRRSPFGRNCGSTSMVFNSCTVVSKSSSPSTDTSTKTVKLTSPSCDEGSKLHEEVFSNSKPWRVSINFSPFKRYDDYSSCRDPQFPTDQRSMHHHLAPDHLASIAQMRTERHSRFWIPTKWVIVAAVSLMHDHVEASDDHWAEAHAPSTEVAEQMPAQCTLRSNFPPLDSTLWNARGSHQQARL